MLRITVGSTIAPRAIALLVGILMVATIVPSNAQGNGFEYQLIIDCPGGNGGSCPVRAVDGDDLMGDPSLAVDPFDPDRLIMASLHGSADDPDAPSPKSRNAQVFTTFTSTDHGARWSDNPFFPPPNLGSGAFGEHPQVTIDPFGFVYIGSLYAVEDGQGKFDYVISAQNFTGISHINQAQNGVYSVKFIPSLYAKNEIKQFWYLYHPQDDIMNMVWWEAPRLAGGGNNQIDVPSLVAKTSPTTAFDNPALAGLDFVNSQQQAETKSGAIGLVWKDRRGYYGQEADEIIQPCDSATNPVRSKEFDQADRNETFTEFVYIGCRVGAGDFRWDPDVLEGTFVMFRFHPDLSELTYLGRTPIIGGEAKIGARSDGRMAIVSAGVEDEKLSLRVAYGSDSGTKIHWTAVEAYGNELDRSTSQQELIDANVQQVIYREDSGVLHLILKQYKNLQGTGSGTALQAVSPNIMKNLVAIDEVHGLLANMDLDIGNILNRTDPVLLAANEAAYNDLSDGFLQLPMAPFVYDGAALGMYQREFFAVGDYGTVIFAEVVELTDIKCPCVPPAPTAPVPLAAPATSLTVTQVMVPAAGITIAGLMATSFAINRSTSHNAAAAKGKK